MRIIRNALWIILFATISFAQGTKHIAIGPYLQNMSSEGVTICWSTLAGESKITAADGKSVQIPSFQQHQIRLARLQPNTTYQYDVLGDGSAEGKGTFTTFPKKIEPFRFAVLGDTRSRHKIHQKIVNMIIKEKPLFVVNTGDLVGNGNDIREWQTFFQINHELMRHTPYFSVLGNHEKDSKNYFNLFDLPGNEHYYFFSVGDALFIVLDSEGPEHPTPVYLKGKAREDFWEKIDLGYLQKEKAWVENVLTLNNQAGFIFVFFHEPLFSIKKSRVAETKKRRKFWGDIFERHHVQVVLNGHDHHYHHAFSGGTHYVTTAGGGAGLYDTDAPQPETVKYKKIEHFVRVDVGLEDAMLTAIDINGEIIEKITVKKRSE